MKIGTLARNLANAQRQVAAKRYGRGGASRAGARGRFLAVAGEVPTMLEQASGRKAHHGFASVIEMNLSQTNDPQEGARLVRAFLRIADAEVRLAIVHMVEKLGSAPAES
ncbi:MAG TPA: hypothetical protein VGF71_00010 [Caulobacteraceae bacterium]